jgi:Cu/Ag efflux protein CusF
MRRFRYVCAAAGIAAAMAFVFTLNAQEAKEEPAKVVEATPAQAPKEVPIKPEELSVYGEVQAVNAGTNSLTVQYYDYDSDEEKTMEVIADKDSKVENAANLGAIKQGDWVDVTYSAVGGKNIAKSIIVEKEEAPEEAAVDVSDED